MSLAKLHTVQKAAKDQGTCDKCKKELPKGSAYIWYVVGFRSKNKRRRCTDSACAPRPSERESSLLADVMSSVEDFDAQMDHCESLEDITSAVQEVAGVMQEVATSYREAGTNPEGVEWNTDFIERADRLDEAADALNEWQPDNETPPGCEQHETNVQDDDTDETCDECADELDAWLTEVKESAQDAVNSVEYS